MYHYTECGLSYVYLVNGFQVEIIDGEEYVSIEAVDGLHDLIAEMIVKKRHAMIGEEVKFLRLEMNMSQKSLAELLGIGVQTVARWEKGHNPIGRTEDATMRTLYMESRDKKSQLGFVLKLLSDCDAIETQQRLEVRSENSRWVAEV